jgi:hypothetical protein
MSEEQASGGEGGRWSSRRKVEVVLRMLRHEDLEALSRELWVLAGTIAQWREQFLAGGQAAVKSRPADERDDALGRLRATSSAGAVWTPTAVASTPILRRVVVLGDGAKWIWEHVATTFGSEGVEILDWYHCSQHLWGSPTRCSV